jgi:hypothetical protein
VQASAGGKMSAKIGTKKGQPTGYPFFMRRNDDYIIPA